MVCDEIKNKKELALVIKEVLRGIWIDRHNATADRSTYEVKRLYTEWGMSVNTCDMVYDFIRLFKPYNFYIVRYIGERDIENDLIFVPAFDEELVSKWGDDLDKYEQWKKRDEFWKKYGMLADAFILDEELN